MPVQPRSDDRIPLHVLTSIDPVLRDSAVFGIVVDTPRTVALRHDILAESGELRRVVVDATGVVEDLLVPLEHACLSCAVREDALPTLRELARDGRWDRVVLALPVSAESLPVSRALSAASEPGSELDALRVATVLTVLDVESAETDLLDDELVSERGIALTEDDGRAIGEVLAAQLEHTDLVVTSGDLRAAPTGSGLVDRLRAAGSERVDGLHHLTVALLDAGRYDAVDGERRAHPLGARGPLHAPVMPGDASWTLELTSSRPFHPERLLEQVERLGTGRLRSRGVFWVPNRPDSLCAWDGAGGQLSIGELGPWQGLTARTRLVFVGAGGEDGPDGPDPDGSALRAELRAAFDEILATGEEMADGGLRWLGREDVLAPWLGARSEAA
ncbi:CobW family GTP-binding protein [Oerskovia flava]|uniref:CobW family GTP-binding protein n=1 Tax=Oerskovia flava TaxID=2986422 RepID=UPI00223F27DE|nr:GTP-binding protein [Oerskovia sp. JB1-3-2]